MSPFISRERFWYYLIVIQIAYLVKVELKMIQSEPRPVWIWDDLAMYGCSTNFGSPSGHSTNSATLAFLLILDLFFPSDWSQRSFPQLNTMTPRSHKLSFAAISLSSLGWCALNMYGRVFQGQHALNQVVMGGVIGVWCAFFSHYVMRDYIFSHISKMTNEVGIMTTS